MQLFVIGIDIGGTKVAIRLEDTQERLVSSTVFATNCNDGEQLYEDLLQAILQLMEQHQIGREHIIGIGVGMPGIIDAQQGIALIQNNVPLENFPIKERLLLQFPQATIEIENDVNVAALNEYKLRHYNVETMLYVTVSTGIAASIIYKGELLQQRGHAGEIGFWKRGFISTLEQDLAGPALEKLLQKKLKMTSSLRNILNEQYSDVKLELEVYIEQLASVLFEMLLFINPHCIVIGGGLINGQKRLFDQLAKNLQHKIDDIGIFGQQKIHIEQAIHKGDSGVKGAILLVK